MSLIFHPFVEKKLQIGDMEKKIYAEKADSPRMLHKFAFKRPQSRE